MGKNKKLEFDDFNDSSFIKGKFKNQINKKQKSLKKSKNNNKTKFV